MCKGESTHTKRVLPISSLLRKRYVYTTARILLKKKKKVTSITT